VQVAEDKDKKAKGADNNKDYREAVKSVLTRVVENEVECDQSVRAAATHAQTTRHLRITTLLPLVTHGGALILTFIDQHTFAHSPKDWRFSNPTRD
jgi:hypothetical protein